MDNKRRTLLKIIAGAGALAALPLIPNCAPARTVTFEQALAEPSKRQTYIDELVRAEFGDRASEFVNGIFYDHEGVRATSDFKSLLEGYLKSEKRNLQLKTELAWDKSAREFAEKFYSNDERFSVKYTLDDYRSKETYRAVEERRIAKVIAYLRTPEGFADLKDKLDKEVKEEMPVQDNTMGGTLIDRFESGRGLKANIYLSKRAFETSDEEFDNVKYPVAPSEQKVIGILWHELQHAMNYSRGIHLGNGLKIDHTNYHLMLSEISEFIEHSIAEMAGLGRLSQFNRLHPSALERYDRAYVQNVINFHFSYSRWLEKLKAEDLPAYERKLLDVHIPLIEQEIGKAASILRQIRIEMKGAMLPEPLPTKEYVPR